MGATSPCSAHFSCAEMSALVAALPLQSTGRNRDAAEQSRAPRCPLKAATRPSFLGVLVLATTRHTTGKSALGQKRTYLGYRGMSALAPKADIKAVRHAAAGNTAKV